MLFAPGKVTSPCELRGNGYQGMFAFSRQLKEKIILLLISVAAQVVAAVVCTSRPETAVLRAILEQTAPDRRISNGSVQTTRDCFYHPGSRLQPGTLEDGSAGDSSGDGGRPVRGAGDVASLGQPERQADPASVRTRRDRRGVPGAPPAAEQRTHAREND